MKNIFLIAIVFASLSVVSCKKCKTCTTTTTQSYSGGTPQSSTSAKDYCGKDYDDAPDESSTTQSTGGITQTVVVDCVEK